MSSIEEVIRTRRTIHSFRDEVPPRDVLLQAIELARWAPNHHLTEPWRFHLPGPETIRAIVELNARLETEAKGAAAGEAKRQRWSGMPGWLIVSGARAADSLRHDEDYAACCCAIQNLSLALWSRGIGVKWTTGGVTRHEEFFRLLNLDPAERRIIGLIWYGWPEEVPTQQRRGVDEIVTIHP